MRKVILISNITHFYHTAKALNKNNMLNKFVSGLYIDKKIFNFLPKSIKKIFLSRINYDLPNQKIKSIWLLDLTYKALLKMKLIPKIKLIKIYNYIFSLLSSRQINGDTNFIHSVSSLSYVVFEKQKTNKSIKLILEERAEHPDYLINTLKLENKKYGLKDQDFDKAVYWRNSVVKEYELSDYIIVSSNFVKKTLTDYGIEKNKIKVLPYGCDTSKFFPIKKNDSKFRIIYVGQINIRKGVHYLIEAHKKLNIPDLELVLIGNIDESIKALIKPEDFHKNNIVYHKYIENHNLVNYYNQADIFILPSLSEAFGLVLLEAMACGLPVIVTKNVGASELIKHNVEGLIINAYSSEEIKNSILELYNDRKKLSAMSDAALKCVKVNTWDKYSENLMSIYDSLD